MSENGPPPPPPPPPAAVVSPVCNSNQITELQTPTTCLCCPKTHTTATAASTATAAAAKPDENSREHAQRLLNWITKDLDHVKEASDKLNKYGVRVTSQITDASTALRTLSELVNRNSAGPREDPIETDVQEEILELKKKVMKLKLQIPSKYKPPKDPESDPSENDNPRPTEPTHGSRRDAASKSLDKLPNMCKNKTLERSSAFEDLKKLYDGLSDRHKVCLLCFSVFPENEVVKKRFMFYWWTGEGFLSPVKGNNDKTTEDLVNEAFKELTEKGFIESFSEKRTLGCLVNKFRMHPFVRAAVIRLAKRAKFFDFDNEGKLSASFEASYRACLLAGNKFFKDGVECDKIHMLFNVDQMILDFEKTELFSMMKNINILCLGRWQTSPLHHIEVEDTKFLEGLRTMKHLKFLSLQGISQIMELPASVSKLVSLTILDLRACPNLEEIPREIGLLRSLTHLDMSECYLLVNMPKELSNLVQLEVLKGFVVGNSQGKNSCTLEHLAELPKLTKLSIFTGRKDFPDNSELRHLNRFVTLRKLTIEWGGGSQGRSENIEPENDTEEIPNGETTKQENPGDIADTQNPVIGGTADNSHTTQAATTRRSLFTTATRTMTRISTRRTDRVASESVLPELPPQLEKLDLQCYPKPYAPEWLKAGKLNKVKKLYIRGGTLRDLGQYDFGEKYQEWQGVEILRLKFLNEMEMDWRELRELFPELVYVEKVRCPKLTLFPCDEQGVWMKNPEKSKKL